MLFMLRKGDTVVVVVDIYRLGQKPLEIIQLAEDFKKEVSISFLSKNAFLTPLMNTVN
jgi:hypothetical protein